MDHITSILNDNNLLCSTDMGLNVVAYIIMYLDSI